jgi:hypothetical protein
MEKILILHNKHWNQNYQNLYSRSIFQKLIKNFSIKQIQILQGVRRSGKSTLFKLLINHLIKTIDPKEILYLNLDDPFFIRFAKQPEIFYDIIETTEKLTGKKVQYLFLDEIQAIKGWEHYVKVAYDNELFKKIFITGSNSSLLNSQYASLLTGRYISDMVYPLSFLEILNIKGIGSYFALIEKKPLVLGIVDEMMKYGSFVEVFDCDETLKRDILSSYYDAIILKDCYENSPIRDLATFKALSYYLISNITSLYSYNSLGKAINIHDKSAKEYVQYLQDAYLFSELKQFSYSMKAQQNNRKKLFVIDNGFIYLSFRFSSNSGILLENLVFTELYKLNRSVFFYNKNFECDFIVKNEDNRFDAIQVCYELNEQNEKREINTLKKIEKKLPINNKIIVTYNQEQKIENIQIIPFWKYFGINSEMSQSVHNPL